MTKLEECLGLFGRAVSGLCSESFEDHGNGSFLRIVTGHGAWVTIEEKDGKISVNQELFDCPRQAAIHAVNCVLWPGEENILKKKGD